MWRSWGKKKNVLIIISPTPTHTHTHIHPPCLPRTVYINRRKGYVWPCIFLVTFRTFFVIHHEMFHWLTVTSLCLGILCLGLQSAGALSSHGIQYPPHVVDMACFRILISGVLLPAPFRPTVGYVRRENNVRAGHRLAGPVERGSWSGPERVDVGCGKSVRGPGASSFLAQQCYADGVCVSARPEEKPGMFFFFFFSLFLLFLLFYAGSEKKIRNPIRPPIISYIYHIICIIS